MQCCNSSEGSESDAQQFRREGPPTSCACGFPSRLRRYGGSSRQALDIMKISAAIFAVLLVSSCVHAKDFHCPKSVDIASIERNPPPGWMAYKDRNPSTARNGMKLGEFVDLSPNDGTPRNGGLGWLIPDNEDERNPRYWIWSVKGLDSLYVSCRYNGTNIWLIQSIDVRTVSICRVSRSLKRWSLLECR